MNKNHNRRSEIQTLSQEQARKLLTALRDHELEAFFTLALATGLRRGELLGLQWQDIDFSTAILEVRRILSLVPTDMLRHEHVYVEAEPKTTTSRRSVVIAPLALESLKRYRQQQEAEEVIASDIKQEYDYVFSLSPGKPLNPQHVVNAWKSILKQAGLPDIRFHALRHTTATLLLAANVPPEIVQEILGHRQISITIDSIFSHVHIESQQEAMSKLQEVLSKSEDEDDDNGLAGAGVPNPPKRK